MTQMKTFAEQDNRKKDKKIDFLSDDLKNRTAKELSQLAPASQVHTTNRASTPPDVQREEHIMDFMTVSGDNSKFIISSYQL